VLAFWNFFDTSDKNWNSKYFGLLTFDKANNHSRTDSSIESLIIEINRVLTETRDTLLPKQMNGEMRVVY
jgi:hypothetical protein